MAAMMNSRVASRPVAAAQTSRPVAISRGRVVRARAAASTEGFKTMRDGVKVAADETLLTPRFYTT